MRKITLNAHNFSVHSHYSNTFKNVFIWESHVFNVELKNVLSYTCMVEFCYPGLL